MQTKVNILLVDDQPAKLLSYEVILDSLGENLLRATSAREALEHLLKKDVAVVLIDVCMPELDGFELAAMIRDHPRCKNTAIIFISAIQFTDMDRIRGYEMGGVDYVPVPVIAEVLRAKVRVFADLYRKTRELENLNRELEARVVARTSELESYAVKLRESETRRSLALAAGNMGSWDWDVLRGDCLLDEGQRRILGVDSSFEPTIENVERLIAPQDLAHLRLAWEQVAGGTDASIEAEFRVLRPNGELRWCMGTAAATRDEFDRIVRISGLTIDITDRKQAEEHQGHLAREVDHRARNILAVVQSIVRLTRAPSIRSYIDSVNGRITALSIAHTLLSQTRWQGADLRRLVDQELAPYHWGTEVVPDDGTDVLLEHRSAQAVGMILHELATNAAKHGALSNEAGRVIVSWETKPDQITLNWREVGGPPTKRPSSEGYGTRVIRGGLLHLGGKAEFNWPSTGLECTLVIPSGSGIPTRLTHLGRLKAEDLPQVLLVEDEPLVAMMMEDSLTHLGFSVIGPHSNVESAAIVARELDLCAALLDINIAGNDIYPVAEICKERGIPVVFVTGYATDHVSKKYAEAAVLQKPIDHQALETLFKGFKQPLYRSA